MQKIILVDKIAGITSFDVIRRLRRKYNIRKMGHAGTLDPFATGLMLIGIEEGTKELNKLLKLDKEYEATVLLGVQTDTGDYTGKKLVESNASFVKRESIEKAVESLVGEHTFVVPKYSAIKQGGVRLYELARSGVDFAPPEKMMTVHSAKLNDILLEKDKQYVSVTFHVASGTYIRTLGEELGKLLGVPATLTALRRTKIGEWSVADAESTPA